MRSGTKYLIRRGQCDGMKKRIIIGAFLMMATLMSSSVKSMAHDAVFERTHEVNEFLIEDAQLLMQVAQAEAGNQGTDGQWLVMSVIINRMRSETFPDTMREVIYQKGQFATVTNGTIESAEPTADTHMALARIECGEIAPQIIGFETTRNKVLSEYFTEVFEYRDHSFYVESKK